MLNEISGKKKVLVWMDSPCAATGFGTVSREILFDLHEMGLYEIDVIGINHFKPEHEFPYKIIPAHVGCKTPFGYAAVIKYLQEGDYDYFFVLNDLGVITPIAAEIYNLCKRRRIITILYFTVDGTIFKPDIPILRTFDVQVAMTRWAAETVAKEAGCEPPPFIHHGVDVDTFFPMEEEERKEFRRTKMGVSDDDFLIISVNRNQQRKDLAAGLLAYARAEIGQSSVLYMHCPPVDNGLNLHVAIDDAFRSNRFKGKVSIENDKRILFPKDYNIDTGGVTREFMNGIMNSGDLFLTTTLGESWGLNATDCLATRTPVVAPNNSAHSENLKDMAYLYDCTDWKFVDSTGYRPFGKTITIANTIKKAWKARGSKNEKIMLDRAQEWAKKHDWRIVNQAWVNVFRNAEKSRNINVFKVGQ